ncbi:MAG TPA: peptide-methionine (S)-S-oxide reductase MsrA [Rhodocyclaceae bacterium]|nr:peptide-methionine (S)-S-oxide reductase MsrA [Rhodocyclaceae bacterium]
METAVLGGGCFWCLEAVFEQVLGVESVKSGYCGGKKPNPSYSEVCEGHTGHVEVVEINFNPASIMFSDLLRIFFAIHDPTTLNRQGNDVGSQYRSAIFYQTPEQQHEADEVIAELGRQQIWDAPIITQVVPAQPFYPAEGYHRQYFRTHPEQAYCSVVVAPKVARFRKRFAPLLKAEYR